MLTIPPGNGREEEQKREKFRIGKFKIFEHILIIEKQIAYFNFLSGKNNHAKVVHKCKFALSFQFPPKKYAKKIKY